MPFVSPPPLPDFVVAHLPFDRRAYRLEHGPDAGRLVHFVDHREDAPRGAPAVLLVHGNPTWSFLWRKVIRRLPEMRCVAPDLLGLGLSDKPRRLDWHSVDRHADAMAELVEALDLRDFVLVAQDWGGPIAAGVGARHPERVAGIVLGNTSVLAPERPRGTAFHRFARLPVLSDLVFRGLGFPQRDLSLVQGDRSSIRGDVSRAYRWPLRHLKDRAAPLALARMVPDGPDHPSIPGLKRGAAFVEAFGGPLELVWGMKDPILGRALRRHEEAFPEARVTRTEAGHFLQEEVPGELAAAVRRVAGGRP
jgi:cis-3-alkyl-4-acyloxetan-2-one decarboxylase